MKAVPEYDQEPLLRLLRTWREKQIFDLPEDDSLLTLLGWQGNFSVPKAPSTHNLPLQDPLSSDGFIGISSPDRSLFLADSEDDNDALITASSKKPKKAQGRDLDSIRTTQVCGAPRAGVPSDPRKRFLDTHQPEGRELKKAMDRNEEEKGHRGNATLMLDETSSSINKSSAQALVDSQLPITENPKDKRLFDLEPVNLRRYSACSGTWLLKVQPYFEEDVLLSSRPITLSITVL